MAVLCAYAVQNSPKTAQNNWNDVGRPTSCNAFATATFLVYNSGIGLNLETLLTLLYISGGGDGGGGDCDHCVI